MPSIEIMDLPWLEKDTHRNGALYIEHHEIPQGNEEPVVEYRTYSQFLTDVTNALASGTPYPFKISGSTLRPILKGNVIAGVITIHVKGGGSNGTLHSAGPVPGAAALPPLLLHSVVGPNPDTLLYTGANLADAIEAINAHFDIPIVAGDPFADRKYPFTEKLQLSMMGASRHTRRNRRNRSSRRSSSRRSSRRSSSRRSSRRSSSRRSRSRSSRNVR